MDPSGLCSEATSSAMACAGFGAMPPYSPECRSREGPDRRTVKWLTPRNPATIAGRRPAAAPVSQTARMSAARRLRIVGASAISASLPDSSCPSSTTFSVGTGLSPADERESRMPQRKAKDCPLSSCAPRQ